MKRERTSGQEILQFDGPLVLSDDYDSRRAKAAAMRRNKRIGPAPRVNGFLRRVGGLFVPHSGTENSAVVYMPEHKARRDKQAAIQRVYEKYDGNEEVPTHRVDLWAHFAGQRAHADLRKKYHGFRNESGANAARIALIVEPLGGQVCRAAFTYDPEYRVDPDSHSARQDVLAYNSVLKYFVDLETFTVARPDLLDKNGRRKWPQSRNNRNYWQRMERAHRELEPLAEDLFAERVDEAYWSHFSRNQFWIDVYNRHEAFVQQQRINVPSSELPPIDVYDRPEVFSAVAVN